MKKIVLKWVLKNYSEFGSVNAKFVMGMCLREEGSLKKDVLKLMKEIEKAIGSVDKLGKEGAKKKLKKDFPEMVGEKKEKKKGPLKELPGAAKGKVVVRIAPSPSGPMHIGHAYGASLNYEYAKMYSGRFVLRIEDTNPENIYSGAYSLIEDDAQWLTDKGVSSVVVQSARLGKYYDYAEKLVSLGKAYVCECDKDEWRKMKADGKACGCRKVSVKEQQIRYAKMFNSYAEGEAVLKLKTSLDDKNPAMRDFSIMRINEQVHPKTGKDSRVWPLMVFSVAIDDHELGMTHVLNGKDHTDNARKEALIMEYLGWKAPTYLHWGRINFEGFKLSTTATKRAIEQGEYTGWDDIRLMTLMALRRRGYQAGAFRRYALEIGLSLNDKTVSQEEFWKNVNAFNRDLIEASANRYFFVDKPKKIKVSGFEGGKAEIELHPNFPKRGSRKFKLGQEFWINSGDLEWMDEGKIHRLMDAFNFEIVGGKFKFVSQNYDDFKNAKNKGRIIHWLPVGSELKMSVLMDDGTEVKGYGEKGLLDLKEGEIVQLERKYFARLDDKKKLKFWYLHK